MNKVLPAVFWLLILILFPVAAHASAIQLPQSGQTTVYSATDDGDIKAGKPWPNPRFNDDGNQTVKDNLTGLIWAKDANLMKNRDPGFDTYGTGGDGAVSWQHALNYIQRLNSEKFLGHNDWRLPNLNELASLVNQGEASASTWLNKQGFVAAQPLLYWTSSTNAMSTATAWTVTMDGGPLDFQKKINCGYVWPVRGVNNGGAATSGVNLPRTGQVDCFDSNGTAISCAGTGQDGELQMGAAWPAPRFMDNGDQTVTDNLTNLIWTRDANLIATRDSSFSLDATNNVGAVTWQVALNYAQKLNQDAYLGFSDWRLPNRNELASVMNYVETNPFVWLNWQGIFNIRNNYWTSATVAAVAGDAWNVNPTGIIVGENKSGAGGGSYVWPVRGGLSVNDSTTLSATTALNTSSVNSLASSSELVSAAATALSVTTSTLANGYIGSAYSKSLAATGGATPYTWSKFSGTLPAGLSVSSAGFISGTPKATGTRSFTVQVKDANSKTATKALTITVYAVVSIGTTSLPNYTTGIAYSQTLAPVGGKAPYTWSITNGSLPAGLALSTAGVISGTPTTSTGSSSFTVQVKDANNVTSSLSLIIVNTIKTPLSVTSFTPPANMIDVSSNTVTASFSELLNPATITNGSFTVSRKVKVTQVATGDSHTVALREDGTVVAWGYYSYVPTGLSGIVAVAAGGNHTVALRSDGTVVAWGDNYDVPAGLSGVVAVSAGNGHTVALKGDGTVVGWGENGSGQAIVPAGLSGVVAISAGGAHTVALKGDGTVVAWGWDGQGQATIPAGLSEVVAVSAGANHTIALKGDGTVVAWGYNENGQTTVPAGLSGVVALSAGNSHTIALKGDGTVIAWGNNYYGQATIPMGLSGIVAVTAGRVALKGDGTVAAWGGASVPDGLSGVVAVAVGSYHTVALKGDGTVVAWGGNYDGQATVPSGLSGVVAVSAGLSHTIALKSDGTVVAWGNNDFGQITVPTGLTGVIMISAGDNYTVALKANGTVVAWGDNNYGQTTVPSGLSGIVALSAGGNHTVALKANGTVVAWGYNEYGQAKVPTGLSGVVAISAGGNHSVALKSDGTVVAWGDNSEGQYTAPTGLSGVVAVTAGADRIAALKGDGTLVAWGQNDYMPYSPYETVMPGTVTWDPATLTATYIPDTPLPNSAIIKATLNQGIKTLSEVRLAADVTWDFSTALIYNDPFIDNIPLSNGYIGIAYNQTLAAAGGTLPYTWSVIAGTLPAGLTLSSAGVISGTPTTLCSNSITFNVTDANGKTATKTLSMTIKPTPPTITTTTLPDGNVGVAYSKTLSATGGKSPYSWSKALGSLPYGMSLSSDGVISGTPTSAGTSNFTLQVLDGNNATVTAQLSINIIPVVSIVTTELSYGAIGSSYNQTHCCPVNN